MFMELRPIARLCATLLLAAGAGQAQAQDDAPKPVQFTVDFGLVSTTGNTKTITLSGGQGFKYTVNRWILSQNFDVVYGETDDSVTTSQWKANGRLDRELGKVFTLFADLRYQRNTFAGIQRRFEEVLGASILALDGGRNRISFDAGFTAVQQRSTNGSNRDYPAGIAAGHYLRTLGSDSKFNFDVEFLPDFDDSSNYRVNGEAKLSAPISGAIALTISYAVRYDNVPEPGFNTTDTVFSSGLQLTF